MLAAGWTKPKLDLNLLELAVLGGPPAAAGPKLQGRTAVEAGPGLEKTNVKTNANANANANANVPSPRQTVADAQLVAVQRALDWLEATTAAFTKHHHAAGRVPTEPLAECILQLRLPTSKVTAGFMALDTLEAVYQYAEGYFVSGRRGQLTLRLPDSAETLGPRRAAAAATADDDDAAAAGAAAAVPGDIEIEIDDPMSNFPRTLHSLGLCPRSALLVTLADDAQRAHIFSATHHTSLEKHHVAKSVSSGKTEAVVQKRAQEKADREKQRSQALAAFKDDRQG